MEVLNTIKLNIIINQTLDPKGGGIILNRVILPMMGFKTLVLMNSPLGKHIKLKGRIVMGIQRKFWVAMLIYITITWRLAFVITEISYN